MMQTRSGGIHLSPRNRHVANLRPRTRTVARAQPSWNNNVDEERSRILRNLTTRGGLQQKLKAFCPDVECDGLEELQLVDLLAEALVQARSQVVRFKLQRSVHSPNRRKYLVVPLDVEGLGFTDFLIDSGTSSTLITSSLRTELGVSPVDGQVTTGLDSAGLTVRQKIALPTLRLGPRELDLKNAIVTKDLSERVGGVLGLSFLRQVEVDVDMQEGTIAFHPCGHAEQGIMDVSGLSKVHLSTIKGAGGLMVACASLNGSSPIPAILDVSASCSTLNVAAARLAGVAADGSDSMTGGFAANMSSKSASRNLSIDPDDVSIELALAEPCSSQDPGEGHRASSGFSTRPAQGAAATAEKAESGSNKGAPVIQPWAWVRCHSSQPIVVREVQNLAPLGVTGPLMILGTDILSEKRAVFAFGSNALYLCP